MSKIDITSTAIEKGLDIAKDFVEKLVTPSAEELGLLAKDQISYWRVKNQIKILNKASALCKENDINVNSISPKLLVPYLENASLEEDEDLQDRWASLLANMADSEQNVQNHVFPYILGQLSKEEFNLLESTLNEKQRKTSEIKSDLLYYRDNKSEIETKLKSKIKGFEQELSDLKAKQGRYSRSESWAIRKSIISLKQELSLTLEHRERRLIRHISEPAVIKEETLQEFELANIVRLGLAQTSYEVSAGTHTIDIPASDPDDSFDTSVDFDVEIDTSVKTVLTQLGELFVEACRIKQSTKETS